MSDNPVSRFVLSVLAIVIGLRLAYELLKPVAPYLLLTLAIAALWRFMRWRRERW